MDLKQIKLIVDLMRRSDLTEFAIEEEGLKLKICRSNSGAPYVATNRGSAAPFPLEGNGQTQAPLPVSPALSAPPLPQVGSPVAAGTGAPAEEPGIVYVKSPMVGTFYRSPSPESPAFAEVGTKLLENSPVGIIEAMKIMNEIQSEVRGTVVEVLVQNGQPVEYGQKLLKLRQG